MTKGGEKRLRVLVVTPLGEGGAGGIDRVMDMLRVQGSQLEGVTLEFLVSRGRRVWQSLWNTPLTGTRILLAVAWRKADIVHLNLSSKASTWRKILLSMVCRLAGVPYVLHVHGSGYEKYWDGARPWLRRRIDELFRQAAVVIVLGEIWRDVVVRRVPETAERIIIVPNATAARPRALGGGDKPCILFLGRLGARKGVPELVSALANLPTHQPWRAVLAGDGAIAETREALASFGLQERVSTPGWVGPAEADDLLHAADVLTLPSHDENLPMSVIEGMAAGLAVVATPAGATGELIRHEETGLLVAAGDANGLSQALARVLADPALRRRLGDAARAEHAARLDASGYGDRLAEAWRLAARHRATPHTRKMPSG